MYDDDDDDYDDYDDYDYDVIEVEEFKFQGKKYLKDEDGNVYTPEPPHTKIGKIALSGKLIFS